MKRVKRTLSCILVLTMLLSVMVTIPMGVSANSTGFDTWFGGLAEKGYTLRGTTGITDGSETVSSNYMYGWSYHSSDVDYWKLNTSPNKFEVQSGINWLWGPDVENDRRGVAVLKVDDVTDIYGANRGTYVYDMDIEIANFSNNENNVSTNQNTCLYLGFFGGTTGEIGADAASPCVSVVNLYTDGWNMSNESASSVQKTEVQEYLDQQTLSDGKYKVVYEYATGSSASEARFNMTITPYTQEGILGAKAVMQASSIAPSRPVGGSVVDTYNNPTADALGRVLVGVRKPVSSSIAVTRAEFFKKQPATTVGEYFEKLPEFSGQGADAKANEFINTANIAELSITSGWEQYVTVTTKPGAIKLDSSAAASWVGDNWKYTSLNMHFPETENIYGSGKAYKFTSNFNLTFNETEATGAGTGVHSRLEPPENEVATGKFQRAIGNFSWGGGTTLQLYRDGIRDSNNNGVTKLPETWNDNTGLLADGAYTMEIVYVAGATSRNGSAVYATLTYYGADGTDEPVSIRLWDGRITNFMVGEATAETAVDSATMGTVSVGICAGPGTLEITGADFSEVNNLATTITYKSSNYEYDSISKKLIVTGNYDYIQGYDATEEYTQYAALYEKTGESYTMIGVDVSGENEIRNGTWVSEIDFDGTLDSDYIIRLFVWDKNLEPAMTSQIVNAKQSQ